MCLQRHFGLKIVLDGCITSTEFTWWLWSSWSKLGNPRLNICTFPCLNATENQAGPTPNAGFGCLKGLDRLDYSACTDNLGKSGGNPLLSAAVGSSWGFSINVWRGALTRQFIPFFFFFSLTAFAGGWAVLCHRQGVGSSLSLLEWGGLARKTLLCHPTGKVVSTGTLESVTSRPYPFTLVGATTVLPETLQSISLRWHCHSMSFSAFSDLQTRLSELTAPLMNPRCLLIWGDHWWWQTLTDPPLCLRTPGRESFSWMLFFSLSDFTCWGLVIWTCFVHIGCQIVVHLFCGMLWPNISDWEDCRTLEL